MAKITKASLEQAALEMAAFEEGAHILTDEEKQTIVAGRYGAYTSFGMSDNQHEAHALAGLDTDLLSTQVGREEHPDANIGTLDIVHRTHDGHQHVHYGHRHFSSGCVLYATYKKQYDDGVWSGGMVAGYGYMGACPGLEQYDYWMDHDWSDEEWDDGNSGGYLGASGGETTDSANNGTGSSSGGSNSSSGSSGSSSGSGSGNPSTPNDVVVLHPIDFRGYNSHDPQGCFRRCNEMLERTGTHIDGKEVMLVEQRNGIVTGSSSSFNHGIDAINDALDSGHPIIVGVDYKNDHTSNRDHVTDHFVIISGRHTDSYGNTFFDFFDPATKDVDKGTKGHSFQVVDGKMIGSFKGNDYRVTTVRTNK